MSFIFFFFPFLPPFGAGGFLFVLLILLLLLYMGKWCDESCCSGVAVVEFLLRLCDLILELRKMGWRSCCHFTFSR